MSTNIEPTKRELVTDLLTLAVSGTPQQLSALSIEALDLIITAISTNTGDIFIGDSSVDPTTQQGTILYAGSSLTLEGVRLNEIYFDGTIATDKISITYTIKR